ncbi:MAG: NRDE family protein, partial [Syntrophobacterales bacterium]|nr:NRDE family protein [Syntrophobacterales bacterium]
YGTRSSTVLLVDREGTVTFEERVFDGGPNSWSSAKYEFRIEAAGKGDRDRP